MRLVDELVLTIEPVTLGGGRALFPADRQLRTFELISAKAAGTGVQVCRYRPLHRGTRHRAGRPRR